MGSQSRHSPLSTPSDSLLEIRMILVVFMAMLIVLSESKPLEVGEEGGVKVEGKFEVDEEAKVEVEEVGGRDLCEEGRSYCEHPTNYPHLAILRAIHRQPGLVATRGLFEPSQHEDGDTEETAEDVEEVYMGEGIVTENKINDYEDYIEIDLYENGIVPY